jgi:hypothetical protein
MKIHGNKGKVMSDEQKELLSKLAKDRVKNPEYKKKLLEWAKKGRQNRVYGEDFKRKMSILHKGKIIPEHQRKINSEVQKKIMSGEGNRQCKIKIEHAKIIKELILKYVNKSVSMKELDIFVSEDFSNNYGIEIKPRSVFEIRKGHHYSCKEIGCLKDWIKK